MSFKIPPGETLKEWMKDNNYDEKKLLAILSKWDITAKYLNDFISGKAVVDDKTAAALQIVTNIPKQMWLNLQKLYDKYS